MPHKHVQKPWRLRADGKEINRSIPLPGGVWLNPIYHNYDMLYGSTFVIQRERVGGPGLVLYNGNADGIQVWEPIEKGTLVTSEPPGPLQHVTGMHLLPGGWDVDEDEEYGPDCTAIVLAGPEVKCDEEPTSSVSPRRTQKMRFTCDRCGTVNTNFVNPHAWEEGTVFCRCEGCQQVHLIRDEKGVFWVPAQKHKGHKLNNMENTLNIPSSLPQEPPTETRVGGVELL